MSDSAGSFGSEHGPAVLGMRMRKRFETLLFASMLLTAALATFGLSACTDELPTDPTKPSGAGVLFMDGCGDDCPGSPPPGEASINLVIPPNNHSDNGGGAINWHATALTIPANHWYYVEVREAISISSNPEYTQYYCCETALAGTVAGPMGVRDSELKTHLGYQTPDGWYEATLTPVTGQPDRARHLVKGPATVWIQRRILWGAGSCVSGTPLGPWDLPDCPVPDGGLYYHSAGAYLMSGVHMVTVKPAAIRLQLAASPGSVLRGDSATFVSSTSDGSPFEVIEWIWHSAAGSSVTAPGTCVAGATTCKYAPLTTGTMHVKARILIGNPPPVEQASAPVEVREPCQTGDPILDDRDVQDSLAAIWKRSNPDDTVWNNRREQGGWIIQNGSDYRFEPFPSTVIIGACSIEIPATVTPPAGTVRFVHTHPWKKGDKPTSCGTTRIPLGGGQFIEVPTTYLNDPSDDDAQTATRLEKDGLVIDKDFVTRFREQPGAIKTQIVSRFPKCGY